MHMGMLFEMLNSKSAPFEKRFALIEEEIALRQNEIDQINKWKNQLTELQNQVQ